MSEVDRYETRLRKFKDPKSRVMRDGRESLRGKDWKARKDELEARSGGQCEFMYFVGDEHNPYSTKYNRCDKEAVIPAHIEPRHPKRDDRIANLMHYCFEHDRLMEKQDWRRTRFGEKCVQETL